MQIHAYCNVPLYFSIFFFYFSLAGVPSSKSLYFCLDEKNYFGNSLCPFILFIQYKFRHTQFMYIGTMFIFHGQLFYNLCVYVCCVCLCLSLLNSKVDFVIPILLFNCFFFFFAFYVVL